MAGLSGSQPDVRTIADDEWLVRGVPRQHVLVSDQGTIFKDAAFNDREVSFSVLSLSGVQYLMAMPDAFAWLAAVNVGYCRHTIGVDAMVHRPEPSNPDHVVVILGTGRNRKARAMLQHAVMIRAEGTPEAVYDALRADVS